MNIYFIEYSCINKKTHKRKINTVQWYLKQVVIWCSMEKKYTWAYCYCLNYCLKVSDVTLLPESDLFFKKLLRIIHKFMSSTECRFCCNFYNIFHETLSFICCLLLHSIPLVNLGFLWAHNTVYLFVSYFLDHWHTFVDCNAVYNFLIKLHLWNGCLGQLLPNLVPYFDHHWILIAPSTLNQSLLQHRCRVASFTWFHAKVMAKIASLTKKCL